MGSVELQGPLAESETMQNEKALPTAGLETTIFGFVVRRSTDCASQALLK